MERRTNPPMSAKTLALGIAIPLAVAGVTALTRNIIHNNFDSKLDVTRFVVDSLANLYERKADRTILLRIDSAVKRIESRTP